MAVSLCECVLDHPNIDATISRAANSLGYVLKTEQEQSLRKFVAGNDVFVSLPTGFGKSLCYILLPCIFDLIREVEGKSIILVVSPLIALMQDQVATISALGITTICITDKETSSSAVTLSVRKGEYQIIFISPEALFLSTRWRNMLSTVTYRSNLVGFIIDEAHCIKKMVWLHVNYRGNLKSTIQFMVDTPETDFIDPYLV